MTSWREVLVEVRSVIFSFIIRDLYSYSSVECVGTKKINGIEWNKGNLKIFIWGIKFFTYFLLFMSFGQWKLIGLSSLSLAWRVDFFNQGFQIFGNNFLLIFYHSCLTHLSDNLQFFRHIHYCSIFLQVCLGLLCFGCDCASSSGSIPEFLSDLTMYPPHNLLQVANLGNPVAL